MNIHRIKLKLRNFQILLEIGISSTIMMNNLRSKLKRKKSSTTMWKTQGGNVTTNEMVTVEFCLPVFNATKIVTWEFHVAYSTEIIYCMILGI